MQTNYRFRDISCSENGIKQNRISQVHSHTVALDVNIQIATHQNILRSVAVVSSWVVGLFENVLIINGGKTKMKHDNTGSREWLPAESNP